MNAYMRPWLLLTVLFVIACLTASQKVDKGISGPDDQEYSGSGEAEVPSTCSNGTCSGNGRCTVETHGDKSVAVCDCDPGVVGRWCGDISQRSYPTYCSPNLCRNDEICKVNVDGYGFVCETPSSGCYSCLPEDCQIIGGIAMCQPSNQHCEPNPCRNGGTCDDPTGNGFVCHCPDGYSGTKCEIRPAIGCTPTTCGVHGDCVLSKCRCHSGLQGEQCDVAPCIPTPSVSEEACLSSKTRYLSTESLARVQFCSPSSRSVPNPLVYPCPHFQEYLFGLRRFVCRCHDGYSGTRCEIRPAIGCTPTTCGVHGNCVLSKCRCHSGWQGEQCDVAPCIPNPCIHGTCTTVDRSFKCRCDPGFEGTLCGDGSNDRCNPNPCARGEICTPSAGGYDCTCAPGYSGLNCRTTSPLGICYPSPCVDGGICTPSAAGYSCTCYRGYSGEDCNMAPPLGNCNPNPCVNGGTCRASTAGYSCTCHGGYSGVNCRTAPPLGSCSTYPNPCRNGGLCIPVGSNRFQCECGRYFSGPRCDVGTGGTSLCLPVNPCQNGGTCSNEFGRPICQCLDGYSGLYCQILLPITPCSPNPCLNGGTCTTRGHNRFQCECGRYFSGPRCDVGHGGMSLCLPVNPCQNRGTCNEFGRPICQCLDGYSGLYCQIPPPITPCFPNPCLNGGTCTTRGQSFECQCSQGYVGTRCEHHFNDYCNSNPCANDEICTSSTAGYVCTCPHGYSGGKCNTVPSSGSCTPNPCLNGGRCSPFGSAALCRCIDGYMGQYCATQPDPCLHNPCRNGGTCRRSLSNKQLVDCSCPDGYTGSYCTEQNNPCLPNPCRNGGTCGRLFEQPICQCIDGYSGLYCQISPPITPCSPNPCLNGGTCTTRGHAALCRCIDGYMGQYCATQPDLCLHNPCRNGGTCRRSLSNKQLVDCSCPDGYTGSYCTEQNNPCLPNPCRNGGTCGRLFEQPICQCLDGYSGLYCQIPPPITPCSPNPCLNGGTCTTRGGAALCRCIDGYMGQYCATQPDPCLHNPCRNGGTCRRSLSNKQLVDCSCPDGYTGPYCTEQNNPCLPNPCRNGGTCGRLFEQSRPYTCDCLPGTGPVGADCELIDSPCNPNPCHGGCKCVASCRHANGYYCRGTNGLLGRNCQIPAPVIVCGENTISVSIDAAVVNEYDAGVGQFTMFMALSHSMISATTCPAQNQGSSYTLVLPLPFNNCGTEVVTNADGKTVVSNYIWLNRLIANGVADMPVPILHFTCEYEKQYSVISSLNPGIDIPPTIVSHGERTDSAVMDLCKSGKFCRSQCPAMYSLSRGATYTVGEDLFLRITPTRVGTQFRISDLFLSCSSDPATTYVTSPIVLLANGCLATGIGKYLPTNVRPMTTGVCASFPVPLLKSCAEFFIHAKLQSCAPGVCVDAYKPCSRRLRRSDRSSEESENGIQVFGPIVVIEGKEGVATKVMYPDEEYVNSTNTGVLVFKDEAVPTITGSNILLPFYASLGVLLLVAVSVTGLLVGHNWHKINAHCGRKV